MGLVAKQVSIAAGLLAVALSMVAATPALANDGWKHRYKHHHHKHHRHHHYLQRDHVLYYSPPTVVYERPVVYREVPLYYAPPMPPSLNINIPLR